MTHRETVQTVLELVQRRVERGSGAAGRAIEHDAFEHDMAAQDWCEAIAFASGHFVLAALAPACASASPGNLVPCEVAEFLAGLTEANVARNRLLLSRLSQVCERLGSIGVVPLVLKGAAFLVEDQAGAADWRFMQDIDLLISAERLEAAVTALEALGYARGGADYDPEHEAHYPPLVSPCGAFSIELHTRLFGRGDFGLDADIIRREARLMTVGGVDVLMPSPRHRLGHLLVHAQVHNRFYAAERLVLKDLVDLSMLAERHGEVVQPGVVDALFGGDRGVHLATRALFDTWMAWRAGPTTAGVHAGTWGRRAWARLERPTWRAWLSLPGDVIRLELNRMRCEAGHLARRCEMLASPSRLTRTAAVWSAKQRQRLWS